MNEVGRLAHVTYEIKAARVVVFSTKLTFSKHFFQKTITLYLCLGFVVFEK